MVLAGAGFVGLGSVVVSGVQLLDLGFAVGVVLGAAVGADDLAGLDGHGRVPLGCVADFTVVLAGVDVLGVPDFFIGCSGPIHRRRHRDLSADPETCERVGPLDDRGIRGLVDDGAR